ncbi:MAG: DNA-binding protein [Caldisericales bacterium]|nr:DNA-binding protein [Caldisericales bacterium]
MCGGGATKTQIVYKSGLNFHTIIPYLDLLTHSGLVVRVDGEIPVYRTTAKGEAALMHLREVERLVWAGTDEEKLIS